MFRFVFFAGMGLLTRLLGRRDAEEAPNADTTAPSNARLGKVKTRSLGSDLNSTKLKEQLANKVKGSSHIPGSFYDRAIEFKAQRRSRERAVAPRSSGVLHMKQGRFSSWVKVHCSIRKGKLGGGPCAVFNARLVARKDCERDGLGRAVVVWRWGPSESGLPRRGAPGVGWIDRVRCIEVGGSVHSVRGVHLNQKIRSNS